MGLRMDGHGQSAVIDMVVFFSILIIASSILINFNGPNVDVDYTVRKTRHIEYADNLLNTLLRSTVRKAYYNTTDDKTVFLYDKSVSELIIEDCLVRSTSYNKIDPDSLHSGIERPIEKLLINMTIPDYGYNLTAYVVDENGIPATGEENGFTVTMVQPDSDIYSADTVLTMTEGSKKVYVTLKVWPR